MHSNAKLQGKYEQTIESEYQRNNKSTKQKNIRCFPSHSESGHTVSGFCGRYLSCLVPNISLPSEDHLIYSWGDFSLLQSSFSDELVPGKKFDLAEIHLKERSREQPLLPWLPGEVVIVPSNHDDGRLTIRLIFNRQLIGWHYSWMSTKYTCSSQHVFRSLLFIRAPNSKDVEFLGMVISPPFRIYSRKKPASDNLSIDSQENNFIEAPIQKSKRTFKNVEDSSSDSSTSDRQTGPKRHTEISATKTNFDDENVNNTPWMTIDQAKAETRTIDTLIEQSQDEMKINRTLDRLMLALFHISAEPLKATSFNQETDRSFQSISSTSSSLNHMDGLGSNIFDILVDEPDLTMIYSVPPSIPPPPLGALELLHLRQAEEAPDRLDSVQLISTSNDNRALGEIWDDLVEIMRKENKNEDEIHNVIRHMKYLQESCIAAFKEFNGFQNMVAYWSSPSGLQRLKEQIRKEQDFDDFIWTRERDDETFNFFDRSRNIENSIFAEMRAIQRVVLYNCIKSMGLTPHFFSDAMELAAARCPAVSDPFYPPSVKMACNVRFSLYGNLSDFWDDDYGCQKQSFRDEAQQKRWAKDLLFVRRGYYRKLLINRIVHDNQVDRVIRDVSSLITKPIDSAWDISGKWEAVLSDNNNSFAAKFMELSMLLSGRRGGMLVIRLLGEMYRILDISTTSGLILINGTQIMMSHPRLLIPLDGRIFKVRPPFPLDILLSHSEVNERDTIGWLSTRPNGTPVICSLVYGPISLSPEELSQAIESSENSNINRVEISHENLKNFIQTKRHQLNIASTDLPELRLLKEIEVIRSVDGRLIEMIWIDSIWVFPSSSFAPPPSEKHNVEYLSTHPHCFQIGGFTSRFKPFSYR